MDVVEGSGPERTIENVDELLKAGFMSVIQMVRASHRLPKVGNDFEYYETFPGFQHFTKYQKSKVLSMIDTLLKNQGIKENFCAERKSTLNEAEDLTDSLVSCNDLFIERINAMMDQVQAKAKKNHGSHVENIEETPLGKPRDAATVSTTNSTLPAPKTVVSSWNKVDKHGRSKSFRLIQAYNIMRPQLKFKDKIDNSPAPFVPKLTKKPNALKPLPDALINLHQKGQQKVGPSDASVALTNLIQSVRNDQDEDPSIYLHPYQYEIEQYQVSEEQLAPTEPIKADVMKPTDCTYIDCVEGLQLLIAELKNYKEIAIDLEAHSYRSYQGIVCLMQISTRKRDYIVDTLQLRSDMQLFNKVFTDPSIVKVFHGADSDIVWLQKDFGVYVVNMFDTGQASRVLQMEKHSLDYLLRHFCGIQSDKRYQLADWRIRPIPEEMMTYAQGDTHYLLYIYDMLKKQLHDEGNGRDHLVRTVFNRSKEITLLKYQKPAPVTEDSHQVFLDKQRQRKSIRKTYDNQQMEALKMLYGWRDNLARIEDESTGYILPNHMMMQIAEILPREEQGVIALCNPIPPMLRQHLNTVHRMIMDARKVPRHNIIQQKPSSSENKDDTTATEKSTVTDPYSDILTCPHDFSHWSPDHTVNVYKPPSKGSGRLKKTSSLFGPFNKEGEGDDQVIDGSRTGVQHACLKGPTPTEEAIATLESLQKEQWNPFALYLPKELNNSNRTPCEQDAVQIATFESMLRGSYTWVLKDIVPTEPDPSNKRTGSMTLSQEESANDSSMNPTPTKQPRTELKTQPPQKEFGTRIQVGDSNRITTEEQVVAIKDMMRNKSQKVKQITKAMKRTHQDHQEDGESNPRPFVPHQYKKSDFSRFGQQSTGGVKRKKQKFKKS